jgi:hypothetical protein
MFTSCLFVHIVFLRTAPTNEEPTKSVGGKFSGFIWGDAVFTHFSVYLLFFN